MKKILLFILVISFSFALIGCAEKSENSDSSPDEILFFYSDTCGHCQKVKQYISDNKIMDKVSYREVAAFTSQTNIDLFNEKAAVCGITEGQRGVPLIFEKGKCYVGSVEGIDFFKNKAGI